MSPQELLMGMEWAARQFYSTASIIERMARSRSGLWWNVARNIGYRLALQNFGNVGFNPEHPACPADTGFPTDISYTFGCWRKEH